MQVQHPSLCAGHVSHTLIAQRFCRLRTTHVSSSLIGAGIVPALAFCIRRHIVSKALLVCAGVIVASRAGSSQAAPSRRQYSRLDSPWAILMGANKDNDALIAELESTGRVQSPRVAEAMRKVDRKHFIRPDMHPRQAYADEALPIGFNQTISAPHIHAAALELLQDHLRPGASVLDVGSGSGYLSAVMGTMLGSSGRVLGVERHPPLAQRSVASLAAAAPDLARAGTVTLVAGNALDAALLAKHGPFDAIHVGAAAANLPKVLVEQLKPGGRMVIPVGEQSDLQVLKCVDKDGEGRVATRDLMGVLFVPLRNSALPSSRDPEL